MATRLLRTSTFGVFARRRSFLFGFADEASLQISSSIFKNYIKYSFRRKSLTTNLIASHSSHSHTLWQSRKLEIRACLSHLCPGLNASEFTLHQRSLDIIRASALIANTMCEEKRCSPPDPSAMGAYVTKCFEKSKACKSLESAVAWSVWLIRAAMAA